MRKPLRKPTDNETWELRVYSAKDGKLKRHVSFSASCTNEALKRVAAYKKRKGFNYHFGRLAANGRYVRGQHFYWSKRKQAWSDVANTEQLKILGELN